MSVVLLPSIRTRQPAGVGRLARANPLRQGLIFCTHGGAQGFDIANNVFPSVPASSVTFNGSGGHGRGVLFGTSGYHSYPNADALLFANGYTVLVVARTTSLAAQSGMVAKWDAGGGGNNVPMTFFVRANGELALWRNVGGGNNGTYGTATGVVVTNRDFVASVDAGSTVHSIPNFYLDGTARSASWTFGPAGSNVALSEPSSSTFGVGCSNGGGSTWQGVIYLGACWNRRLSAAEHLALHVNPWQLIEDDELPYFFTAGATNLVIADATHAHAADNLTLTQQHVLVVADASHAHLADNLTLTQAHVLAIADALHAHAADNVVLSVEGTLTIADALHAHTADSPALTQSHVLTVADALHAHLADNLTLVAGGTTLEIADALHAHLADAPALTQLHILTVSDALHAHLADTLTLSVPGAAILHNRVLLVRGENRTLVILPENRTLTVH